MGKVNRSVKTLLVILLGGISLSGWGWLAYIITQAYLYTPKGVIIAFNFNEFNEILFEFILFWVLASISIAIPLALIYDEVRLS